MYLRNDPRYIHQTCILETVPSRTAASAWIRDLRLRFQHSYEWHKRINLSVEPPIERSDRHSNLVLSLFCLGSLIETASELGRKNFKSKPENKGKLYTGGFFAFARHVNFGGYAMWRIGLAVFCGGLSWGGIMVAYWAWYFSRMGIPAIDEYLKEKVCSALFRSRESGAKLWDSIVKLGRNMSAACHISCFRVFIEPEIKFFSSGNHEFAFWVSN